MILSVKNIEIDLGRYLSEGSYCWFFEIQKNIGLKVYKEIKNIKKQKRKIDELYENAKNSVKYLPILYDFYIINNKYFGISMEIYDSTIITNPIFSRVKKDFKKDGYRLTWDTKKSCQFGISKDSQLKLLDIHCERKGKII